MDITGPRSYGRYRSSAEGTTGCVKEFFSQARAATDNYPPSVSYKCSACETEHSFRLLGIWIVATPGQQKSFEEYCAAQQIDLDIELEN